MKLYYWDWVETLADYGSGKAFALASSKEEAVEAINTSYPYESEKDSNRNCFLLIL